MADPRSSSTRRAFLSYSHLQELTDWPELLVNDYQGIQQDFNYTADEIDLLEVRVAANETDIVIIKEDIVTIKDDINDLQLRVAALEYRFYDIVVTPIGITTEQFQTIICSNVSPIDITLKLDPMIGDEVNIKRRGDTVNVIGTIDGFVNKTINVLNYSMKLVFNGTDWSEI